MSKDKQYPTATPYLPLKPTLERLRTAASVCKGCALWKSATQTVFGEGGMNLRVMLVGEQPGDQEDLSGRPFVGPAGRILNFALEKARIDREEVYITNAVKHFKFELRGKRRIHKKPNVGEIHACRPWLEQEIKVIQPEVIVCLGATAAAAILGPSFRVTQSRGQFIDSPLAPHVLGTIHPAVLLRAPDEEARRSGIAEFVEDLVKVRKAIA